MEKFSFLLGYVSKLFIRQNWCVIHGPFKNRKKSVWVEQKVIKTLANKIFQTIIKKSKVNSKEMLGYKISNFNCCIWGHTRNKQV